MLFTKKSTVLPNADLEPYKGYAGLIFGKGAPTETFGHESGLLFSPRKKTLSEIFKQVRSLSLHETLSKLFEREAEYCIFYTVKFNMLDITASHGAQIENIKSFFKKNGIDYLDLNQGPLRTENRNGSKSSSLERQTFNTDYWLVTLKFDKSLTDRVRKVILEIDKAAEGSTWKRVQRFASPDMKIAA